MEVATRRNDTQEVIRELSRAGATAYGLFKSESRYLPHILHKNEHIHAVIYGQHRSSSAMLIATDERVIYLDKKPMAVLMDEVTYDVVSGVELDIHTFFATVTLHTAVANYEIKFVNLHCADNFVNYIEEQRLKRQVEKLNNDSKKLIREAEQVKQHINARLHSDNLAGYYWIPLERDTEEV